MFACDGEYRAAIERFHIHEGHKGTSLQVQMRIVTSKRTVDYCDPHPAGDERWVIHNWDQEYGPQDTKQLLCAMKGWSNDDWNEQQKAEFMAAGKEDREPEDLTVKLVSEAIEDGNPFRGVYLDVKTRRVETAKQAETHGGKNKTPVLSRNLYARFHHVPNQDVPAQRAALDAMVAEPAPVATGGRSAADILAKVNG